MNDTIYGFLAKIYGLVERGHNIDIELEDTYKNFSKQQLKKELSRLKKFESDNVKGAVGSADLKISKSALLSLNHHNFSNTKPIYTE